MSRRSASARTASGGELAKRRLADALDRLAAADLAGLGQSWRRAFGRPAPAALSRALMHRVLAYKLQADALGDLDRETARALDRLGEGSADAIPAHDGRGSQSGTLLVREWNGEQQTVMVLDQGFAWSGRTFRSLSEVARAITGTRWNGPRFFGLRGKTVPSGCPDQRRAA